MKRIYGKEYSFCPTTYILPEDYTRFTADRENHPKTLWIIKPAASSCGKGIRVLGPNSHINRKNGMVVSKYVKHPHLVDGCKYDLRIYVCITSFNPLRIYMYQSGLVRIATEEYTTKSNRKRFIHLTNYSI
jgi:tubulin polyglutamylase TTLL4